MRELEITNNILSHTLNIDGCKYPEASHLIEMMLHVDKDQRPSAQEILSHPFFWSNQKKIKFLEATGNQPEVCQSHSKPIAQSNSSDFEKELESSFGVQFHTRPWSEWSASMVEIYKEMMSSGRRKYLTSSAVELLRFIRNAYQHVSDKSRSCSFQKFLLTDYEFFDNFESLVIEVYKAVTKHGWDNRLEIKNAI
jgi:serine/threonine-protein kinase/endoribonuclease IRE1